MQEVLMVAEDVSIQRLQLQAQAQACRVVQDIKTHAMVLLFVEGASVACTDVGVARSWLRRYAECSVFARRCFAGGKCVCSVHGFSRKVASQCVDAY